MWLMRLMFNVCQNQSRKERAGSGRHTGAKKVKIAMDTGHHINLHQQSHITLHDIVHQDEAFPARSAG